MKQLMIIAIAVITSFTATAQHEKHLPSADTTVKQKVKYSCSMHPEITSDKPGKCSKCGMDLTKSKKEKMKMEVMKMYTCPMHPEVTSEKPGKCSKCGMDLTKVKTKTKVTKD